MTSHPPWGPDTGRARGAAIIGIDGHLIEAAAAISNGLAAFDLLGLPDTGIRETRDRIRAAILNSGQRWPARKLLQRSGNVCAFPDCRLLLTAAGTPDEPVVVLGEMAHIVAESPNGPRGDSPLTAEERSLYQNLILLCNQHHQLIDSEGAQPRIGRVGDSGGNHQLRLRCARAGSAIRNCQMDVINRGVWIDRRTGATSGPTV